MPFKSLSFCPWYIRIGKINTYSGCALLNIAHSSNRFWLFVDLTEAALDHFVITFQASVFSVLETWGEQIYF